MAFSKPSVANDDGAAETLVLAADAGGTKTSVWLAEVGTDGTYKVLGRGNSTSANPLTVGVSAATQAIGDAIERAFGDAEQPVTRVGRAVFSVAGAAKESIRDQLLDWAANERIAQRVAVVSDILPVLAAGTDDCCGVALVAGTGSVALARDRNGRTARCGGWGYLLGDDGSGYAIGRAALRHTLECLEANDTRSRLADHVLQQLDCHTVAAVTARIYESAIPRATIAELAPLVAELAADGDELADEIIFQAASDLAALVIRAAGTVGLVGESFVVAAAGGVVVGSTTLQDRLRAALAGQRLSCDLRLVDQPLVGCLRLATQEFAGLGFA